MRYFNINQVEKERYYEEIHTKKKRYDEKRYYEEEYVQERRKTSTNEKRYTWNQVGNWYKVKSQESKCEETLSSDKHRRIRKMAENMFEIEIVW